MVHRLILTMTNSLSHNNLRRLELFRFVEITSEVAHKQHGANQKGGESHPSFTDSGFHAWSRESFGRIWAGKDGILLAIELLRTMRGKDKLVGIERMLIIERRRRLPCAALSGAASAYAKRTAGILIERLLRPARVEPRMLLQRLSYTCP